MGAAKQSRVSTQSSSQRGPSAHGGAGCQPAGLRTGNSLCAREPHLCAKLIERRRRFAEQSKKALKNRLKVVLKENPPPSLREVHARLGVTRAISRNFPEINRAISARHREFQRQSEIRRSRSQTAG